MMNNLRRSLLACAIVLICLAACSCVSHVARPDAPKSEVAPAMKNKVEDALGVLGDEIVRQAPVDDKSAFALLRSYLGQNPDIYGAAFAFAPVNKNGSMVKSSPYVYRSSGDLIEKNLIDAYDYSIQDWFVLPANAKSPVWSKPYFDEGGGDAWMITYSIPIYSDEMQPRFIGVLTSDLLIPNE